MSRPRAFEVLARTTAHRGFCDLDVLELRHERFAGGTTVPLRRELLRQREAVAVVPYDPAHDLVLLVEQFRVGALADPDGPWLIEAPAGIVEAGETIEDVARREVLEESGVRLGRLAAGPAFYSSPGISSERVRLFAGEARLADAGGLHGRADEGEDIRIHVLGAALAFAWLDQGRIGGVAGVAALLWLRQRRPALRRAWAAAPGEA